MYNLIKAIKELFDRLVISKRNLRASASAGSTTISVAKAWEFSNCDTLLITEGDCSELQEIKKIEDGLTLQLSAPLTQAYTTSATIEKVYAGQQISTFIGDPPVLPKLPAITVDLDSKTQEPLALQTFTDEFSLIVSVYVSLEDFDKSFKLLHDLTAMVEGSLFITMFPLIEPFLETTLAEDVNPGDLVLHTVDPILGASVSFVLSNDRKTTNHRTKNALGNNVYEFAIAPNTDYAAGERVIRSLIHTYDAHVESINYRDARQGETTLKVSTLTYMLKIARHRQA